MMALNKQQFIDFLQQLPDDLVIALLSVEESKTGIIVHNLSPGIIYEPQVNTLLTFSLRYIASSVVKTTTGNIFKIASARNTDCGSEHDV